MSIGYLQITLADHKANEFRVVGGAEFPTMRETRQRFRAVPEDATGDVLDGDGTLILDLCDRDLDILDNKYISRGTAEALMGETLDLEASDSPEKP